MASRRIQTVEQYGLKKEPTSKTTIKSTSRQTSLRPTNLQINDEISGRNTTRLDHLESIKLHIAQHNS